MKTIYIIILTLISNSFLISGNPIIEAEDWNFGIFNINIPTPYYKNIRIENKSNTDDLIITGASRLNLPVFTAVFDLKNGTIKRIDDITHQNPLFLRANSYLDFMIYCKPTTTGFFRDSIVFSSNATSIDSITYINGEGVGTLSSVESDDLVNKYIKIINIDNSIIISKITEEPLQYKLISLTGSQIAGGNLDTATEIFLDNLPKQMLFLEITNSNNEAIIRKKILI